MRTPAWIILGLIPGSGEIFVLHCAYQGSAKQARGAMSQGAKEHFGKEADKAICEIFNILCGDPQLIRTQLKEYFRKVGVPLNELDETVKLFTERFQEETEKAKYKN